MTREQQEAVRTEALSWLNTPFRHNTRLKGVGVDCVQLLIAVFSEVGLIEPFEPEHYSKDWFLHRSDEKYLDGLRQYAEPVEQPFLLGDIFTYRFARAISHAGIYMEDGWLIHANGKAGRVTLSQIKMPSLARRFAGAWRIGK